VYKRRCRELFVKFTVVYLLLTMQVLYLTAMPGTKPGQCPRVEPETAGVCWEQCSSNADCSDDLKCCSNGCGHVCMTPGINQLISDDDT